MFELAKKLLPRKRENALLTNGTTVLFCESPDTDTVARLAAEVRNGVAVTTDRVKFAVKGGTATPIGRQTAAEAAETDVLLKEWHQDIWQVPNPLVVMSPA